MQNPHSIALYWFRRSIRLDDNRALAAALQQARTVIPVFILDPTILTHPSTGEARTRFLFQSLTELDHSLRKRGSRLILRYGQPVAQLERLIDETRATALFFSRDYEPYSRERDTTVAQAMQQRGVLVVTENDHLLTEPGDILTATGKPYTVFTPYRRNWQNAPVAVPLPPAYLDALRPVPESLLGESVPDAPATVGVEPQGIQTPLVSGGETEALRRLEAFVQGTVEQYNVSREQPGREGTSRLSAYLRMGVISPRRVLAAVQKKREQVSAVSGVETFLSELAWRDFYYQILWHFPHVAEGAFRTELNDIAWENDETLFAAWCAGQTGYPIVDAAQRQMNTEAWMHNRARMITASFLTKDLLCNWQLGERYFMQKLIDGDLASNNGGWQWAASTGTDAQPFFRIFNPVAQGERFDPDGTYVKRWVPELTRVPAKYIHRPWELSRAEQETVGCLLGRDYPYPIVDHKTQREKALRLYRKSGADE